MVSVFCIAKVIKDKCIFIIHIHKPVFLRSSYLTEPFYAHFKSFCRRFNVFFLSIDNRLKKIRERLVYCSNRFSVVKNVVEVYF